MVLRPRRDPQLADDHLHKVLPIRRAHHAWRRCEQADIFNVNGAGREYQCLARLV